MAQMATVNQNGYAECPPIFKLLSLPHSAVNCVKAVLKDLTTHEMCHYTTLWNIWHHFQLKLSNSLASAPLCM